MLKINSFGKSDIGLKRSNNEDAFMIKPEAGILTVDNPSIQQVLSFSLSLTQKGEKLIELAKLAGGYDNITVAFGEVM